MALLEVRGLSRSFGGLAAVSELDFDVNEGEILGIIGPNGAGKSTVFNLISGAIPVTSGTLHFRGEDITKLAPHERAGRGISRLFQGNVLFPNFTVVTNVVAGLHLHTNLGLFGFPFRRSFRTSQREDAPSKGHGDTPICRAGRRGGENRFKPAPWKSAPFVPCRGTGHLPEAPAAR